MLEKLKLTNFRRHRELAVSYTAGMNITRGANESGKSTLGEACLYALFGAKALRTSLADAVTWGEKDTSLRVELNWAVDGNVYTFLRHKGGAEVRLGDKVLVTGQTEVSNFAANLLGADATMASNLMFANQGNLRGALEQGPKATAEMIENLANFDLFEQLIERMQERLIIGSPKLFEDRLANAQSRLETYANPEKPDVSQHEAELKEAIEKAAEYKGQIPALEAQVVSLKEDAARAQAHQRTRQLLEGNLKKSRETYELHKAQLEKAQQKASRPIPEDRIALLSQAIADISVLAERRKAYLAVQKVVASYPVTLWEGTAESLVTEINLTTDLRDKAKEQLAAAKRELEQAKHDLIHDRNCKTCGQDVSKVFDIDKRNAEAQGKIDALEPKISELGNSVAEHEDTLAVLKQVQASAAVFDKAARTYAEYVEVDYNVVPPAIVWKGEAPSSDAQDIAELKAEFEALESQKAETLKAKVQVETLTDTLTEDEERIAQLEAQIADLPPEVDADAMKRKLNKAENTVSEFQYMVKEYEAAQERCKEEIRAAMEGYTAALKARDQAQSEVEAIQEELRQLNFNNNLLKRVRAARPVVSDKLWAMVLTAVSAMFSKMRGEPSVVTKGASGFLVNGQAVASLSGSTLDLLGLSIRCALLKTFVPNASMIMLDEPAAASDPDRTANMLAFIQSAGFPQTILITHEEISSGLADSVIALD